jgi:hypothetical protein
MSTVKVSLSIAVIAADHCMSLCLLCAIVINAEQQSKSPEARPASPPAAKAAEAAPAVTDKSATSKLIAVETLATTAPSSPSRSAAGYVPYELLKGLGKVQQHT